MSPALKWILGILGGLLGIGVIVILGVVLYVSSSWDSPHVRPAVDLKAPTDEATVARGEYLFKYTHTCWGCHSPVPNGDAPPSGGKSFDLTKVGPGFGIYYTPNITPDNETGIGTWTDGEIVRALREGIRKDGRALFPLMPIEALKGLSDEDALAIVAYLRTIPPVRNNVRPSEPSFFLKTLFTFGGIKPEPPITEPIVAPAKGVTAAYGAYMANSGAGCMDCHTPRSDEDGSFYRDSLFAGSAFLFGEDEESVEVFSYATNITPDNETGIGSWTEDQFLEAVRVGMRPDGTVLSFHMPYSYFGLMDEDDLKAIYLYLKTVPPLKRTTPPTMAAATYREAGPERGAVIYENSCMICHGDKGKGAPPTRAVLAEVAPSFDDKLMHDFVSAGNIGLRMPAFGKTLTPDQIDDVIAHIRSWELKNQ